MLCRLRGKFPNIAHIPFVTDDNRFIINDSFRSDLCLLYPPHLIAIAATYLTLVLHCSTRDSLGLYSSDSTQGSNRRSSRSSQSQSKKPGQDAIGFMAGLNVNMEVISSIAQEIISRYILWWRYGEDAVAASARSSFASDQQSSATSSLKRTASGQLRSASDAKSQDGTPIDSTQQASEETRRPAVITPTFLTKLLVRMREGRMADMAHPATGRPMALDKRLERAQNA